MAKMRVLKNAGRKPVIPSLVLQVKNETDAPKGANLLAAPRLCETSNHVFAAGERRNRWNFSSIFVNVYHDFVDRGYP